MSMLIDSHSHLDMYTEAGSDPDELPGVLTRAFAAGVRMIVAIGIGDGPATMHRALDIAEATVSPELPTIYASVGIHPQEAHKTTPQTLTQLATLAARKRCIAVGEIGLDYYHLNNPDIPTQQAAFVAQLQIAKAAGKPILIHCRTSELATSAAKQKYEPYGGPPAAWDDLLRLLNEHWTPAQRGETPAGIMHCFSGTVEQARRSLDLGFYLSFAGNLTYPAAHSIREAAAFAPADRILVETDAPFLAPIPHRGKRNEPAFVIHTAAALASIRSITSEALATLTANNFHALFPTTPLLTANH